MLQVKHEFAETGALSRGGTCATGGEQLTIRVMTASAHTEGSRVERTDIPFGTAGR